MENIVKNNHDFLFIYEAINTNPNGDPDQENKPRMDKETNTNLVSDVRIKRSIRDYLKQKGYDIFVDMEGTTKVSVDTRIKNVIKSLLEETDIMAIDSIPDDVKDFWVKLLEVGEGMDIAKLYDTMLALYGGTGTDFKKSDIGKKLEMDHNDFKKKVEKLNNELLFYITQQMFIDIRFFGSAVAVSGFPKTVTGAIQLTWGYSLNEVELLKSDSIVTIMNDGSSTFGKDYRVKYSLLAFYGAVNKFWAKQNNLTENDLKLFREAIWNSVSNNVSHTKTGQFPKLYVEVEYAENYTNGTLGDLRNYITVEYPDGDYKKVKNYADLKVDYAKLWDVLKQAKKDGIITKVLVKYSIDFDINEIPEDFRS